MPALVGSNGLVINIFEVADRFHLFGDLHVNSSQFAIACEEAGADAIILHLNEDAPRGARFGGWEIEEQSIRDSLSVLKIPAGLSMGDNRILLLSDWESIVGLNFAFINMFAHQMPSFIWDDSRINKVVSIGSGYVTEQVREISESAPASALILSLTPPQGLGLPLTLLDLSTFGIITKLSKKPVLMPTQRLIRPADLKLLKEKGCRGVIVSSVVYGESTEGCKEQIMEFRKEISK